MRHETIARAIDSADLAVLYPSAVDIAPHAIADIAGTAFQPTPAAADVPASVGGMIAAAYAAVVAALFFATAGSALSVFVITISALFVVTFFTIPRIFFGIEPMSRPRIGFDRFIDDGIDTLTGHTSGRDAIVQMIIVPVFLTFGIAAMGVAVAWYL